MKLFEFNPNDYGSYALVMAENKEDAIKYLFDSMGTNGKIEDDYNKRSFEEMSEEKNGYTIDVYEAGQVIHGCHA